MTKLEYANEVKSYFSSNYIIEVREIKKNNGVIETGLAIKTNPKDSISSVVYIDDYYDKNLSAKIAAEKVKKVLENSSKSPKLGFFNDLSSFDKMKPYIHMELVNALMNEDVLKDCPCRRWNDLFIIYYIKSPEVASNGTVGTVKITNALLKTWKVTEEDLYYLSLEYIKEHTILFALPYMESAGMISLSNDDKYRGAACVLNKDFLAKHFKEDKYFLPSSIHEWIVISKDASKLADFQEMVKSINADASIVNPKEILSNFVYEYNHITHEVTLA